MKYKREQKTTILVVLITAFVTTFTGSALNLSIPDLGGYFGVSAGAVGWLVTAYMLTVAALSVPFGKLADRAGRKRILTVGILIFSASSGAAAFGVSLWMLIALRVVQGVGGAMIFSTNIPVLIGAFSGEERGKILGYSIAATYTGLSAGPVLGGFLNYHLGWRSIFALTALIGAVALFLAWLRLPADKKNTSRRQPRDIWGNLLYVAMITLTMYGLSELDRGKLPFLVTGVGVAIGVLFVYRQLHTEHPVIQVRIFRKNPAYACANAAALLNYGATFAISYLLSIYLQAVKGYSSQTAGFILIAQPALMALLSPLAGRISDRFSPFLLSSIGMALCAGGLFLFAGIGETTSLFFIFAALVITGVGFAFFSSPNTNAVMSCVEEKDYGVASSILATMRSVGHTLSMVVVTVVVRLHMGEKALEDAGAELLIKTMRAAFLLFAAACTAGVLISLKRNPSEKQD